MNAWEERKRLYRRAHGGRNSPWLAGLEGLGCLLLVPVLVLSLPFVLLHLAWQEKRRRCPACGRRGTLRVAPLPQEDQDDWTALGLGRTVRRRVNPEATRLRCEGCGATFSREELRRLGVSV